jgi:hypothetical protein
MVREDQMNRTGHDAAVRGRGPPKRQLRLKKHPANSVLVEVLTADHRSGRGSPVLGGDDSHEEMGISRRRRAKPE